MTDRSNCILGHRTDPDRPRPALDGAYICHGHREELGRLIAEMPAVHDDLTRANGPGGPRPPGSSGGITVDDPAAEHRMRIAGVIASWTKLVCEDRGLTPPREDIYSMCALLTLHVDWIAAQSWVDEILPELRGLAGRALGIVDIPGRRVDLGQQCLIHHDGERCDGQVTLIIRGDDWTASCPACRERCKPGPAPRQDAAPYLKNLRGWISTDGVMRLARRWGVPCSEDVVRQWKHRGKIRGESRADGTAYDARSVVDYLSKRTARERMSA